MIHYSSEESGTCRLQSGTIPDASVALSAESRFFSSQQNGEATVTIESKRDNPEIPGILESL
jgi:hypothetical protein